MPCATPLRMPFHQHNRYSLTSSCFKYRIPATIPFTGRRSLVLIWTLEGGHSTAPRGYAQSLSPNELFALLPSGKFETGNLTVRIERRIAAVRRHETCRQPGLGFHRFVGFCTAEFAGMPVGLGGLLANRLREKRRICQGHDYDRRRGSLREKIDPMGSIITTLVMGQWPLPLPSVKEIYTCPLLP
jgi:hypothetical protein